MLGWIDTDGRFRIAIAPRPLGPGGSEGVIAAWAADGVEIVVSLLTDDQVLWLGLESEAEMCAARGIELRRFPVADHSVPDDRAAMVAFARELLAELEAGRAACVHCLAGIGRSGMMAVLVLCLAGFELDEARARVSDARGIPCPETGEQIAWLEETVRLL